MSDHITIGRVTTNAAPAWKPTAVDTLVSFGNAPSTLLALMSWPGGSAITNMDGGGDGTPEMQMRGWGSAWYVRDAGMHGTMVYQRTGEFTMENQQAGLPLSASSPAWEWWRQPFACLTEAAAATADADFYFNVADWDAIKAATPQRIVNNASWGSWDGVFPVGMPESNQRGWIVRRKVKNNSFGNSIMARARYDAHTYIPASWTGTGNGALVFNPHTLGGPFQGWQSQPSGIAKAAWFDTIGASGEVRMKLGFCDAVTKVHSLAPVYIPDFVQLLGTPAGPCFKDEARRRLYWIGQSASGWGYWYADFSAGIAGMTTGGFTLLTAVGTPTDFSPTDAASGGFTVGHVDGKRIGYWMAGNVSTPHLWCFNLDTGQYKYLDLTGRGLAWVMPTGKPRMSMTYHAASNAMLMIEHASAASTGTTAQVWVHRFTVPSDPFDTASYTVSKAQVATGSATVNDPEWMFGDRCDLVEWGGALGPGIVLPNRTAVPMCFIPSL